MIVNVNLDMLQEILKYLPFLYSSIGIGFGTTFNFIWYKIVVLIAEPENDITELAKADERSPLSLTSQTMKIHENQ